MASSTSDSINCDGLADGLLHGLAQARASRPSPRREPTVPGSQPTTSTRPGWPPMVFTSRRTLTGSSECGSSIRLSGRGLCRIVRLGLDDIKRAWRTAARGRVDQDHEVEILEQGHGEVEAANAEIDHPNILGPWLVRRSRRTTSTPNASSPRKILPMPATRMRGGMISSSARRRRSGSTSSGR